MLRFCSPRGAVCTIAVVLLLGALPTASAAPGEGDAAFGDAGFVTHDLETGIDRGTDMVAMPDGRLVVLSTAVRASGYWGGDTRWAHVVTRLLPSGAPDPTFGDGGRVEVDLGTLGELRPDLPTDIGVAGDGSIVVTGLHAAHDRRIVVHAARLLPDGRPNAVWSGDPSGRRELTVEGPDPSRWIAWPELLRLATGELVVTFTWRSPATGELRRTVLRLDPAFELDPRFGQGTGHASVPVRSGAAPVVDPSGRLIEVRLESSSGSGPETLALRVARSLADGTPDETFGAGDGVVDVDVTRWLEDPRSLEVDVAGDHLLITTTEGVLRLDSAGALDTTFGTAGFVAIQAYPKAHAEVLDGGLAVVRQVHAGRCVDVWRFDASGAPLPGFGVAGQAEVCPRSGQNELVATAATSSGLRILTSSTAVNGLDATATVSAVGDDGRLDPAFGGEGTLDTRDATRGDDRAVALRLLGDGRMRMAIESPRGVGVLGLTAAGERDAAYGTDGEALTNRGLGSLTAMALQIDGRVVVGGHGGLLRFDAVGRLDPTFGDRGLVELDGTVRDLLQLTDGRLLVAMAGTRELLALHPDGAVDGSFEVVRNWPRGEPRGLARRGAGFLLVAGDAVAGTIGAYGADGSPDPSYADGAVRSLGLTYSQLGRAVIATDASGGAFVSSGRDIVSVSSAGQLRPFALAGLGDEERYLWDDDPAGCAICSLVVDGTGRLLVARGSAHGIWVERLLATGARDLAFGDRGIRIANPADTTAGVADIQLDADGRIVAAATTVRHWQPATDVLVARIDPREPTDLPTVTVTDVTYEEGTSYPRVTVELDRPSTVTVIVTLRLQDGSALEAEDWQQLQVPVVVTPGSTTGSAPLRLIDSPWIEGDETITVRVVEAFQARGEGGHGTVTVLDDDALSDPVAGDGFVSFGLGPTTRDAGVLADVDPSTYNDHVPAVGYIVTVRQPGSLRLRVVPVDTLHISIDGLRNGVPAEVYVLPFTKHGFGQLGAPTRITPTREGEGQRPSPAPTEVVVAPGVGRLDVGWAPPPEEGGAAITGYFAVAQTPTGAVAAVETVAGDARNVALRGLSSSVRYTVSVVPLTAAGIGMGASVAASPKAVGSEPAGPWAPAQPIYALASRSGRTGTVVWGPPTRDNGAPITGYHVIVVQDGEVRSWQAFGPGIRSASFGGLQTGPASVHVVPANAAGFGQSHVVGI